MNRVLPRSLLIAVMVLGCGPHGVRRGVSASIETDALDDSGPTEAPDGEAPGADDAGGSADSGGGAGATAPDPTDAGTGGDDGPEADAGGGAQEDGATAATDDAREMGKVDVLGPTDTAAAVPTAAELLAVARTCPTQVADNLPTDGPGQPASTRVTLCSGTGARWMTGDLDVACDGKPGAVCNATNVSQFQPTSGCKDRAGQSLSADKLPFVVYPGDQPVLKDYFKLVGCGQVVAVIFKEKLVYAVTGDQTNDSGTGDGSYALCKALGLSDVQCDPGGKGPGADVTYIFFTGPGATLADAGDHQEAVAKGERLAAEVIARNR